ncbi:MAG: adenosylmethionine--8-amino-7-oxononanoate transaminase [Deltaproteobacteria bacterium]
MRGFSKKAVKQLEEWDKDYIWHPFTQMKEWVSESNLIIEKGKGSYLYDIRGNRYLDGVSSLWVTVHGHRKREINNAIKKQLGKVAHSTLLGLSNVPAVELAKRLVEIAPRAEEEKMRRWEDGKVGSTSQPLNLLNSSLSKVFYSDSGSTSVEIALKIAFQYWQNKGVKDKTRFLTFKNAYHGDTIGSVSLGGMELFHDIYRPLLFKTIQVNSPYCYRCHLGKEYPSCKIACLKEVEDTLKKQHKEVAALVIEPLVQGAAGMLLQPAGFLKELRVLCDRYKILMIADEVATGFGRTGKMFACDHEGVVPDILCVAKGITGGYLPLAATLTTREIHDAFLAEYKELKTFFHGHTYTGNPLACAAAIANLDIFEKEETLKRLQPKISLMENELKRFTGLSHVGDIRQKGFMVGIELVKKKDTREPYPVELRMGHRVILEARKRGAILRPLGNVIVLMPPLSIKKSELERLLKITYESIRVVTE